MQRFAVAPALLTLLLLIASCAGAAPTGQLVFIRGDVVHVAPAAGGAARRLPRSDHAWYVSASPTDGTVLYFVAPAAAKWDEPTSTDGLISRPPYASARPLPPPLDHPYSPEVRWTADGKMAFWSAGDRNGTYDPATGRIGSAPAPVDAISASRDGRVVAYATEREIKVRWRATGRERTLFSIGNPQPLFAALRRARYPEKLRKLIDDIKPALWRQSSNWQLGRPALTPDGRTLFFATNAGSGMDDARCSAFCFFATDVETGKLSVLSRSGLFQGWFPWACQVSPDGERLFFVMSTKISAREEWRDAYVVDLLTQEHRELLHMEPKHAHEMNLTDGACWSPDGRYLAIAVLYYNERMAFETAGWEPRSDEFVLLIKEAATGRTVRQIQGARRPSWSRPASTDRGSTRLSHPQWTLQLRDGESFEALSPDWKTVVTVQPLTAGRNRVRLWEVGTSRLKRALVVPGGGEDALVFRALISPDGRTLATETETARGTLRVRLWDLQTGRLKRMLTTPEGAGMTGDRVSLAFSPDSATLATIGVADIPEEERAVIRLWDLQTGRATRRLPRTANVCSVAFSPDGRLLAGLSWVYNELIVKLWDLRTGTASRTLAGRNVAVRRIVFSPDGRLLAGLSDSGVKLWDLESGRIVRTLPEPADHIAFSANGTSLVTVTEATDRGGGQDKARVWDLRTGRLKQTVVIDGTHRVDAVSPDATTGATISERAVRLWRIR